MFFYFTASLDWYLCVLLYNFLAYAMQAPLGLLADRLSKNWLLALAGCVLIIAAFAICMLIDTDQFVLVAVTLLGIGYALFHLGGGIDVLNVSEGRFGPVGLFISPSAFGIFFGTMLGKGKWGIAHIVVGALIAIAILIIVVRLLMGRSYPRNAPFSLEMSGATRAGSQQKTLSIALLFAAICFFLVVFLRSYAGMILNYELKSPSDLWLFTMFGVVPGTAIGGFLADRFGALRIATISLGIAAVLFLFATMPNPGIMAIISFSITIPITLCSMVRVFPGAKGFSLGLLTFGLFLGFLPAYLGLVPPSGPVVDVSLAAISLALLWPALRIALGTIKKKEG